MKMKLCTLVIGLVLGINAQAQNFEWAYNMGGSGAATVRAVALDSMGNVYTTGYFTGNSDFDQGLASFVLNSSGSFGQYDIYVQKSDSNGDFVWAKKFGGNNHDRGYGITVDLSGNVLITGDFENTVDFDPGSGIHNLISSIGTRDVFILKLRPNGDFVWAKQIKAVNDSKGSSILTDDKGSVYTSGFFQGNSSDFDPGVGTFILHSGGTNVNGGFIQKLDSNGNFKWAKALVKYTGAGSSVITSTQLSSTGHLYSTGYFTGRVDFNPNSPTNFVTSTGSNDIFIQKMDTAGNFEWIKTIGSTANEITNSLAVDWQDNVFVTGYFRAPLDFDPGTAVFNLSTNLAGTDPRDIFIQKLDSSGNFLWAKKIGGRLADVGYSIATDAVGNIYNTGIYSETTDFDPSFGGTEILTNSGSTDVYLQKLAPNGDFLWAKKIGAGNDDYGFSIVIDSFYNIYTAGQFYGIADFDPSPSGTSSLNSSSLQDGFVQKLSQCAPVKSVDTRNGCGSLLWYGKTYSVNNHTAVRRLASTSGCDSLVFLNLTINDTSSSVASHIACNSYTWIDGVTYTASNNSATKLLTNSVGCDSLVKLSLTINTINRGITLSGSTLVASLSGATYQWVDCFNLNSPISGATSRSFTPSTNGSYACIINDGTCSDTSSCIAVKLTTGIEQKGIDKLSVYPNPVKDRLTIKLNKNQFVQLDILDVSGKKVMTSTTFNSALDVSNLAKGMYSIRVVTQSGVRVGKFVKE
jgi:hypothetical protein